MRDTGYKNVDERVIPAQVRMAFGLHALEMMEEAFGAYRAVLSDQVEEVRDAAWAEVAEVLKVFEGKEGFLAPAEVLIGTGTKPI